MQSPTDGALLESAARGAADAAERIAAALREAQAVDDPGRDRELVGALARARDVDTLLEAAAPETLAALAERVAGRLDPQAPDGEWRAAAWELLDVLRRPALLRRIEPAQIGAWSDRLLTLVDGSHFTVGPLLRQRCDAYGSRPLFVVPGARGRESLSWRQVALRVETLARGLLALDSPESGGDPGPVAILSENRAEMLLCDLACLSAGIVNVLIPANATAADVGYMLGESAARTVIVSDRRQLAKVQQVQARLSHLRHVISFDTPHASDGDVLSLELVRAGADRVPAERLRDRIDAVRIDALASIMYTSGTTGTPKGIRFTQRNIVFKRFARALALPEIGEQDRFLCYLPLFHTFGRFLEMLACVFWGATYHMLDNPSVDSLVRGMQRVRPTVFISVPRKWIQLYEAIAAEVDPLDADDAKQREAVRRLTGGELRWGLSAAGHLDSEVFRFFQHHGVELLSGFGMTEATGGITMTPPGCYRDDSLGPALPGIELRLADDGELWIRGPYVMQGYMQQLEGEGHFDADGWFATGDLMEQDDDGFLRLVDRKKEIYKNVRGETIAPQRIESLFRDFESVGRVFLVGDHRPYNTVLIHPAADSETLPAEQRDAESLRDHFRSVIASVNGFLAPYERIVDFALIDRDLQLERGELTPKGTPRRKVVERHFNDAIRALYQRTTLRVGGLGLIIPNWIFQAVGLTAKDIRVRDDALHVPSLGTSLSVKSCGDARVQIGSCFYTAAPGPIDLGSLLSAPSLWLGNEQLVALFALDLAAFERHERRRQLTWCGRVDSETAPAPRRHDNGHERSLLGLHETAVRLSGGDERRALEAIRDLEDAVADEQSGLVESARVLLRRTALSTSIEVRRLGLRVLVPAERPQRFRQTLESFLDGPEVLLDEDTRAELVERDFSPRKLGVWIRMAEHACSNPYWRALPGCSGSLLRLLAEYGAVHPTQYRRLRAFLVRMMLFAEDNAVRAEASNARRKMTEGFRQWLGPTSRIAVDAETAREYRWQDVVVFDDEVPDDHRTRLLDAFRNTGLLREAVFLFSGRVTIRLDDIPPGGVWVRRLGARHDKAVYRVTVQTRFEGSHELAVNVSDGVDEETLREEVHWLILCGDGSSGPALTENFGGFWGKRGLWTEEFVSGETLERGLLRLSRRDDEERFHLTWPFLAWTTLAANVDFWNRTGRRWLLDDPDLSNVVVPTHDYHTGARIVSLARRRLYAGPADMLLRMREGVIRSAEERHPGLAGIVSWDVVFSALLEVVGEKDGVAMLREVVQSGDDKLPGDMLEALTRYIGGVAEFGFRPMRLYFAIQRYKRWAALTEGATPPARARTLQEFWDTYRLSDLIAGYPETRVRFFRQTVFRDAPQALTDGLDALVGRLRRREIQADELTDSIADLRSGLQAAPDDDYFLARLSFPHLRPEDAAGFELAQRAGRRASEMVVTLDDRDGARYRVRHAMSAKEVGRLHRLFVGAKLDVRFRPEHQFLVALNERNQIIGGIYYDTDVEAHTAHIEKIVVADAYRKKGVSDGLMNEFFNRMRATGVKTVTTGFFRPEYFYAKGFKIEKRYAGLVKTIEAPED